MMSKSLIKHTQELLDILTECLDRVNTAATPEDGRNAAMQAAAIARAVTANMEVQGRSMELLADELWEQAEAEALVRERTGEMAEAEM